MAERNLAVDHVHHPALGPALCAGFESADSPRNSPFQSVLAGGAVNSAGETIGFMLSPKRDLIAAALFLLLAVSNGGPRPRAINMDGSAVAELKQTGELTRRVVAEPRLI